MGSLTDTMPPRSVASHAVLTYAKAGAAALVIGAAFGGGLLFGAHGDEGPVVDDKPLLAAADANTEKLEAVQEKLRLVFHEELTGPPRDKAEGVRITPTDVVQNTASQPTPRPTEAPSAAEEASSGTEPPAAPVAEKPAPASRDNDDDDAPAPAEDEEMIATPPKAETEADRTRVARALAKVLGDDAAATLPAAASTVAPRFAVQIASTPSEEGADALVTKLRGAGHKAAVVGVDIPGKGVMYRVRVSGFSSRDAAMAYREQLGEGLVVAE